MIFEENADMEKLPEIWAEKYREYLGVTPEKDSEGILQDIHWAGGSFGYFPSYALGNAIAAQIYAHLKRSCLWRIIWKPVIFNRSTVIYGNISTVSEKQKQPAKFLKR